MEKSALLIMDMQTGILGRMPDTTALVTNVRKALDAARRKKQLVLFVRVTLRTGAPDLSMKNKSFSLGGRERWTSEYIETWASIHPELTPQEDEPIVTKRRVSAFTGSDLEVILRAQAIDRIVLSGVSTSGVVLSTLREAADKDYSITVLSDCCFDPDPEVHAMLVTKIFPRQADIRSVDEWSKE